MNQILSTKLHIPRIPSHQTVRPRLLRRLNGALARKVTLISAPAGYGKTFLLGSWAGQLDSPLAWITLDEKDGDVTRFLLYLATALAAFDESIGKGITLSLQPPQPAPIPQVLTILINDVVRYAQPCVIVLDDFHLVASPKVLEAAQFLIQYMPTNMHLVIATRSDPPLPLHTLRVQGELLELRASDLAFTAEETAELLSTLTEVPLAPEHVSILTERTEGWVAGLQIAGIALRNSRDPNTFVSAFSGSNRYILEYLLEEVFQNQSQDVQDFLIKTSILDNLTAPLCEAVTDRTDAQETLMYLEHANLFLHALDDESRWYRYHRLFQDLLHQNLQQWPQATLHSLHDRASHWYASHQYWPEAIDHALQAADYERAAQMVESEAQRAFMRSQTGLLLDWIERLPLEMVEGHPKLGVYSAWAMMLAGYPTSEVRKRLDSADGEEISGEVDALHALLATLLGDLAAGLERSRRALDLLPVDNAYLRSIAASNLSMVLIMSGDLEAATRALDVAIHTGQKAGNVLFTTGALCNLAGLYFIRAQPHQARERYLQALAFATDEQGRRLPAAARALLGLSEIWREWNDLERAAIDLHACLDLSRHSGEYTTIMAYLHLARVTAAQGSYSQALAIMAQARQLARQSDATILDDLLVELSQARLHFDHGDLDAAWRWIKDRGLDRPPAELMALRANVRSDLPYDLQMSEWIMAARIFIAQKRAGDALTLLEPIRTEANHSQRARRVIEIQNLMALAHHARGNDVAAHRMLDQSLQRAEPGNHIRIFVDEGEAMAHLLSQQAADSNLHAYIGRILACFARERSPAAVGSSSSPVQGDLVEALSERELEILQLIALGQSNRAIADKLVITISTVKGHTSHIYAKLGVKNRTEAVAKGRALGLLS